MSFVVTVTDGHRSLAVYVDTGGLLPIERTAVEYVKQLDPKAKWRARNVRAADLGPVRPAVEEAA